jgi:protein-tyrosine phosphatase
VTSLPAPRGSHPYRIAMICSGNICRSPTAEVVLTSRLTDAGLHDQVEVVSGGIGDWHVGDPMDSRSAAVLTREGYDATRHRAAQVDRSWFDSCDVLLAMDESHLRDLRALAGRVGADPQRVLMFRAVDPEGAEGEVPDPYYGGGQGFEEVLAMVERTNAAWVDALSQLLSSDRGAS